MGNPIYLGRNDEIKTMIDANEWMQILKILNPEVNIPFDEIQIIQDIIFQYPSTLIAELNFGFFKKFVSAELHYTLLTIPNVKYVRRNTSSKYGYTYQIALSGPSLLLDTIIQEIPIAKHLLIIQ